MLRVENISYKYRGCDYTIKDISFQINKGEFLAILGNNGVGKSTLLKCCNRIHKVEFGKIFIENENIMSMSRLDVAKKVAFVTQDIPKIEMTVYDAVMLGRRPHMKWNFTEKDHEIVNRVLKRLYISDEDKGCYLSQLSGGERQKVMLARVLAQEPELLLLDEPTSSLDLKNQYQVLQIVRNICDRDKIAVVMVIHDINLALRFCDKFLLMREGRVHEFGGLNVIDSKSLSEVYNIGGKIIDIEGNNMVLVDEYGGQNG